MEWRKGESPGKEGRRRRGQESGVQYLKLNGLSHPFLASLSCICLLKKELPKRRPGGLKHSVSGLESTVRLVLDGRE